MMISCRSLEQISGINNYDLKVNICHLSLQNDSSVKLNIALNTKILLKKLNCLLKIMLNLEMAFKSIKYEFKAVNKGSPTSRDSHRSRKPAVTLFQYISYKMGQQHFSSASDSDIHSSAFHYFLQVKTHKCIMWSEFRKINNWSYLYIIVSIYIAYILINIKRGLSVEELSVQAGVKGGFNFCLPKLYHSVYATIQN